MAYLIAEGRGVAVSRLLMAKWANACEACWKRPVYTRYAATTSPVRVLPFCMG
jgi:hypothetical protein